MAKAHKHLNIFYKGNIRHPKLAVSVFHICVERMAYKQGRFRVVFGAPLRKYTIRREHASAIGHYLLYEYERLADIETPGACLKNVDKRERKGDDNATYDPAPGGS